MERLRITRVFYARFRATDYILTDNDECKTTQWMLYSSLCYGTNKEARENGFKKLSISFNNPEESYYLPITPDDLESAYSVENYCEYKGEELKCGYEDDEDMFYINMIYEDRSLYEKFGLTEAYKRVLCSYGYDDSGMLLSIPDSEILNVWEIHKPIDGFPFKGPEKVWVKRDGVWLR